jgi:HAD superfamily hydrolase (TIGR01509 family)
MLRKPVEAVLFDMDGLLLDTEAVYAEALQAAARSMDVVLPIEFCHSTSGIPGAQRRLMIQNFFGSAFPIDDFNKHFSVQVRRLLETGIPTKPGVVALLDFLDARGLKLAVATSAARTTAERHLGRAGLLDRFTAMATRDDVARAKPHPDVYLEAARRLAVAPERCIAFEDSDTGLTAAHAAGTMAIMVPDTLQPSPEVLAKCLTVVPDLHEALRLLRAEL